CRGREANIRSRVTSPRSPNRSPSPSRRQLRAGPESPRAAGPNSHACKSSHPLMNAGRSAIVCERIRAQVSLELDGELSELERRMLSAHLDRCDDCSDYARDLSRITDDLRSAPLEQLTHPLVVQRLRRLSFPRMQVGVA